MAIKCVAQMPNPVAIAETASQMRHIRPIDLRTCCNSVNAVNDASKQKPQIMRVGDAILDS